MDTPERSEQRKSGSSGMRTGSRRRSSRIRYHGRWWAAAAALAALAAVAVGDLPPGTECIPILTELEPCLPFVQQEHSGEQPTPDCCAVLKDVHRKSASCLCRLLHAEQNQPPTPGINLTLALQLPGACHLKVNPSRCPALLGEDSSAPPPSAAPGGGDLDAAAAKPPSSSSPLSCHRWLLLATVLLLLLASSMLM